jgi:hypothetical protein
LKNPPPPSPIVGEWRVFALLKGVNDPTFYDAGGGPVYSFSSAGRLTVQNRDGGEAEWKYKASDKQLPRTLDLPPASGRGPASTRSTGTG